MLQVQIVKRHLILQLKVILRTVIFFRLLIGLTYSWLIGFTFYVPLDKK